MRFELLPVLDQMIALYQLPLGRDRFQAYLKLLHGNTRNDMAMPIGHYNPMAKPHVLQQLLLLKELQAEEQIQQTLQSLNLKIRTEHYPDVSFKTALVLADDLKGGWTNHYTTDYDSKFKNSAYLKRHFCIVLCFSSETIKTDVLTRRTLQYAYRTLYQLTHGKCITLHDHLQQETYVATQCGLPPLNINDSHREYQHTDDYPAIISLLYGDEAAQALGYPPLGVASIALN